MRDANDLDLAWKALKQRLLIGSLVSGSVVSHHHFGFFVDFGGPFKGLVSIIEVREQPGTSPEHFPPVGSIIEARVVGFKEHGRQVWLSLRSSLRNGISDAQ